MSVGQGGGIFFLLQIMNVSIQFNDQPRLVTVKVSPHPASPKYDDVNFESAFRLILVVFGGGAEGGGAR